MFPKDISANSTLLGSLEGCILTDNIGTRIKHGVITLHLHCLARIVFFPAVHHRGKILLHDH